VSCKMLTSGEMRTRHNQFRYGRYEVRMKPPEVQAGNVDINGSYVATMFVYRDGKFRHWREIDVEVLGDGQTFTNVLVAENTTVYRAEIAAGDIYATDFNVRADFHTYAFEWLPDSVTWFIDDVEVRSFTGQGNVTVPELSTKILMSMWIWIDSAWSFGGPDGDNNRYPLKMEYEWFRYYKWDDDSSYPCAGLETECLTDDDKYLSSNNPCDGIHQVGDELRQPCGTAICTFSASPNFTNAVPEVCTNLPVVSSSASPPAPPTPTGSLPPWMLVAAFSLLVVFALVALVFLFRTREAEGQVDETVEL